MDPITNFVQYKIEELHPYCYYDFSVKAVLNSTSPINAGFDEDSLTTKEVVVTGNTASIFSETIVNLGKTNAEPPPLLSQRTDTPVLNMSNVVIGKGTISFDVASLPFSDAFGPLLR